MKRIVKFLCWSDILPNAITLMLDYQCQGVWNHWYLDCWTNCPESPHHWPLDKRISQVTGRFPSQRPMMRKLCPCCDVIMKCGSLYNSWDILTVPLEGVGVLAEVIPPPPWLITGSQTSIPSWQDITLPNPSPWLLLGNYGGISDHGHNHCLVT